MKGAGTSGGNVSFGLKTKTTKQEVTYYFSLILISYKYCRLDFCATENVYLEKELIP